MKYVLDTTALFNARDFPPDFDIAVPEEVLEELERWGLGERSDLLEESRLRIYAAGDESRKKVKKAAEKTGDIDRLSPTDIEVLALALDIGVPVISDDYSIQNVAEVLGVKFIPLEEKGIKKVYYWKYRCRGCGKEFARDVNECDVCGQTLKPFKYKAEDRK